MFPAQPALHREGPFVLLSRSELPPNSRQAPVQPGPAHPRYMVELGRTARHNVQVNRAAPARVHGSGQAVMYPVWEGTLPLITSRMVLIVRPNDFFYAALGPISRSSPPRHARVPLPVCLSSLCIEVLPPSGAPSHLVPLCRENAVKLPSAGPPQGCETRQRRTHQSPHHRPRDPIESRIPYLVHRLHYSGSQYTQILAHNFPHMARRVCPRLVLPGPPFREISFGCHRVTQ